MKAGGQNEFKARQASALNAAQGAPRNSSESSEKLRVLSLRCRDGCLTKLSASSL